MLPQKRKLISLGKIARKDSQELTGALLESNDKVYKDTVCGEGRQGDRYVDESHSGGFDEGVIHRCFSVA